MTAGVAAVILYGSLFPFQFLPNPDPFGTLLESGDGLDRYDIVANILLYIPLGLFAAQAFRPKSPVLRVGLVALFGAVLSLAIELLQSYDVGRGSGLPDVGSNGAGTLLGALAAVQFPRLLDLPFIGRVERRPFVILLLASWLGFWLFPYVPTVTPMEVRAVLRPIVLPSGLSPVVMFQQLAVWLAVALLLQALVGVARSRVGFGWLVFLALAARGWVAGPALTAEPVWSGLAAVLIWIAFLWRWNQRAGLIAALFAIHIALDALRPFQFSPHARSFGLVPFLGFMNGPRDSGVASFLNKVFMYGTLVWVTVAAGWRWGTAAAVSAALVLVLRILQIYLPGRSAEITDTIMVLALAGAMKLLAENPAQTGHAGGNAINRYPTPRTVSR